MNYYYDNAIRLYNVTQGSTNTLIGYDNANRRSKLTLPNGIVLTYGYDNDSRIKSMSYQLGTTNVGSLSYQYDAAGRRIQMGGSLAATGFPQAVGSAVYDVANELTNWNGTTITPDANGNILNDGVAAHTWNARNQLISRGSISFQYDSYGRRTLNAAGNSLLYEGWNAGQELSGTTPIANRILGGIDEFFSRADSSGGSSPITDALGSVLALTNSSGNTTTQYSYDPFGNTTSYGGTSTNVFQYTSRENDGNGLYFYRARYYNSGFGRFVSQDPAGFAFGPNLYQYTYDSPTNFVDTLGLTSGENPKAASTASPEPRLTTILKAATNEQSTPTGSTPSLTPKIAELVNQSRGFGSELRPIRRQQFQRALAASAVAVESADNPEDAQIYTELLSIGRRYSLLD